MQRLLLRPETLLLGVALLLIAGAAAALYLMQATTLTIAVAPKDGTEPALIQAFADALRSNRASVRLKILPFEDVRESAAALQDGRSDLAVVRPDVSLPRNGLTLAILPDQAMIIVSPKSAGIDEFRELAKKRLGFIAEHEADLSVLKSLGSFYNLEMLAPDGERRSEPDGGERTVTLVPLNESGVAAAFAKKAVDAVVIIIAPAAPKALKLVQAVIEASRGRTVNFVSVPDDEAVIQRLPKLQAVTIPSGLFQGSPKAPAEEVKTVGTSYRLMARASLSRAVASDITQHLFELRTEMAQSTEAADYLMPPSYETTVAATSARLPNHPGAIDYYEREQKSLIDRYGDLVYLLALVGGGLGSAFAWFRQRFLRHRQERVDAMMQRLHEIHTEVQSATDDYALGRLRHEVDEVALELVHHLQERDVSPQMVSAVVIAIDTARSAIAEHSAFDSTSRDSLLLHAHSDQA
jgi:TRAP-type uncharacterized transport system substrate-binding protein